MRLIVTGSPRTLRGHVILLVGSLVLWLAACGSSSKPAPKHAVPTEPAEEVHGPMLPAPPPAETEGETAQPDDIQTQELTYEVDGVPHVGFLAIAPGESPGPGVLVVHEWWGATDYVRERARMLARMGYTALALDMYGEGKTADHPDDAKAFSSAVMSDLPAAERKFAAAYQLLSEQPSVDSTRTAAIGYCFGGAVVLHAMRAQVVPLRAVATFHGSLGGPLKKPAAPGSIDTKVLVMTGDADPLIPAQAVIGFEKEMTKAKIDYHVVHYPEAKHGFTNPEATAFGERFDMPLAYDPEADAQSWAELESFLQKTLGE